MHLGLSRSDDEQEPLKAGDLVKIELGCHVDYYSAVVAHTVKVSWGAGDAAKAEERAALSSCPLHLYGS